MKKQIVLIFFLIANLVGCVKSNESDVEKNESFNKIEETTKETTVSIPNNQEHKYDPAPLTDYPSLGVKGAKKEIAYDNISVRMEYDTYTIDEKIIKCFVKNGNPGRGFFVYQTVGVEYWENDQWVRLKYRYENFEWYETYNVCAVENEPDMEYQTAVFFEPRILDEYKTGKYRLIVFVGPNKYYAEFEVVEEKE